MGDRPLDPVHHHLAPPGAAEYAHGVEIRERCDAGADRERLARGASVIQPREGGAGGGHAKAGRGARGVATVPVAVERIRIGGRRGVVRVDRVVGVSDQVDPALDPRSEEHTSELQSRLHIVCRLLLETKNTETTFSTSTELQSSSIMYVTRCTIASSCCPNCWITIIRTSHRISIRACSSETLTCTCGH